MDKSLLTASTGSLAGLVLWNRLPHEQQWFPTMNFPISNNWRFACLESRGSFKSSTKVPFAPRAGAYISSRRSTIAQIHRSISFSRQVLFKGTIGGGSTSDMAVDDVSFTPGECIKPMSGTKLLTWTNTLVDRNSNGNCYRFIVLYWIGDDRFDSSCLKPLHGSHYPLAKWYPRTRSSWCDVLSLSLPSSQLHSWCNHLSFE